MTMHQDMAEFKRLLAQGDVQRGYRGLMAYLHSLRTHCASAYPDYAVSGSVYQGYMDMSYFSVIPASFKSRGLKVAIVFLYDTFRFEVWLAGYNKKVQAVYWDLFQRGPCIPYCPVPSTAGSDAIIEHVLVEDPEFGDIDALTRTIVDGAAVFIRDIEHFLSSHTP